MSAFSELPADKRAVVELVLRSGRSYDQIAELLKIDRAAVRARALAAFDDLAPEWGEHLPEARRALITDYLLGQLPGRVAEQVRERLGHEDAERAWAEQVAAELAGVAAGTLPEIPQPSEGPPEAAPATPPPATPPPATPTPGAPRPTRPGLGGREPRSSRQGGALLLGLGALIVIAVIVIVLVIALGGGGSSKHSTSTTSASTPTLPTGTTGTTGTATAPGNASSKALTVTILNPVSTGSKSKGAAEVISEKGQLWLFLVAVNLPANATHPQNYYAVWLTNDPTRPSDSQLIGFQTVGSSGRLATFAPGFKLSYARFKKMVVTLETKANPVPKTPGTVVLSGPFSLK